MNDHELADAAYEKQAAQDLPFLAAGLLTLGMFISICLFSWALIYFKW